MSDVTANNQGLQADSLDLINTELAARLARQSDAGAQIDTKAIALVGYAGAASLFLATRHFQPVLGGAAFAAYAAAAAAGIWAFAVGTYEDVPDPRPLFNNYAIRPKSDALAAMAATRVEVFESNVPKHNRKAERWRVSLAALMLGVILMVASLLVHTGSHVKSVGPGQHPVHATATTGTTEDGR